MGLEDIKDQNICSIWYVWCLSVTIQGEQVYLPHTLQPHWRRGCGTWRLEGGHGSPQVPVAFHFTSLYAFLCSFPGVQKTIISSPLPSSGATRLDPANDMSAEEGLPPKPISYLFSHHKSHCWDGGATGEVETESLCPNPQSCQSTGTTVGLIYVLSQQHFGACSLLQHGLDWADWSGPRLPGALKIAWGSWIYFQSGYMSWQNVFCFLREFDQWGVVTLVSFQAGQNSGCL